MVAIGDGLILPVTDCVSDVDLLKVRLTEDDVVGNREGGIVKGAEGDRVTERVIVTQTVGLIVRLCDRVRLTETVGDTDRV